MWICDTCEYEYSAMLSDDDVPEICECGGKIREAEGIKTYQVIIEQAMTIEAENEETAKRIAAECFDFGSADISANETESEAAQ